jgi:diguanylate cyclase (GGDEF)-like protein
MKRWTRPAIALAAWIAIVVLVAEHGMAMGVYQVLPWGFAVAVTGALLGAWIGVASGAAIGSLVAFGIDPTGAALQPWAMVVAQGALLLPLALMGVGFAAAAGVRLQTQLHLHRDAFDRAQYDVLTGAYNRRSFERRLEEWMRLPGAADSGFAVLFVDLDRFKFVNDTFGHAVGDKLLLAITKVLMSNVREGDLVARQGGDEFVVALAGVSNGDAAAAIASKLVAQLGTPFHVDGKLLSISASVGVALYPHDGSDVQAIVKSADAAMYAVKASGKNAFHFSSEEQRRRQARRLEIEHELRTALRDHEFEVVYQPQLELASGRLVGFEALLRWRNGKLGTVAPSEFVPIAEDAGMIVPIGHWLMREACRQAQAWQPLAPQLTMAINVSSLQFRQPDFLSQVADAIADAGVAAGRIELEVTESILIDQFELAVSTLLELDKMGVRSALDDFGTGYSSLAYLQKLPIRSLKIDRSFIRELALGPTGIVGDALPIVEAIAAMGLKLGRWWSRKGSRATLRPVTSTTSASTSPRATTTPSRWAPPRHEQLLKRLAAIPAPNQGRSPIPGDPLDRRVAAAPPRRGPGPPPTPGAGDRGRARLRRLRPRLRRVTVSEGAPGRARRRRRAHRPAAVSAGRPSDGQRLD